MPYVQRKSGTVCGVYVQRQPGIAEELMDESHADIVAYNSSADWSELRRLRNGRLSKCDWTQVSDSPLSAGDVTLWATYRQTLRDLPANTVDPTSPTWPEEPS